MKELIEKLEKVKSITKKWNGLSFEYRIGDILMDEITTALQQSEWVKVEDKRKAELVQELTLLRDTIQKFGLVDEVIMIHNAIVYLSQSLQPLPTPPNE